MDSGENRIGAAQSDDEAVGAGISYLEFVSSSFLAIYITFHYLQDFRCSSFPIHFWIDFRFPSATVLSRLYLHAGQSHTSQQTQKPPPIRGPCWLGT
jgi:hypothetical protein